VCTVAAVERSQGLRTDVNKVIIEIQVDEVEQFWKYYIDFNIY